MKQVGWWRRNLWGLLGLVPAALLLLALSAEHIYYGVWSSNPRFPIPADASGRYPMRGAEFRLITLSEATGLELYSGKPFTPPPNVTIWLARVEIEADVDAPAGEGVGGCDMLIEDQKGRLYESDTRELDGLANDKATGCIPMDYKIKGKATYVNDVYFALPRDARGVAVRITTIVDMPNYVRLAPGN